MRARKTDRKPLMKGRMALVWMLLSITGAPASGAAKRIFTEDFNDGLFEEAIQLNTRDVTVSFPGDEGRSGSGALKITGDHNCSQVRFDVRFVQPAGSGSRLRLYRRMSGLQGRLHLDAIVNPWDVSFPQVVQNLVASTNGPVVGGTGWKLFETQVPTNLSDADRTVVMSILAFGPGGVCDGTAGPFTFWIDNVTIDHIDERQTDASLNFECNNWQPFSLEVPDATSGRIRTLGIQTSPEHSHFGDRALKVVGVNTCSGARLVLRFTQPAGQQSQLQLFVKSSSSHTGGRVVLSAAGLSAEQSSGNLPYRKLALTVPVHSMHEDREVTAYISFRGPAGVCSTIAPFTFWIDDIQILSSPSQLR